MKSNADNRGAGTTPPPPNVSTPHDRSSAVHDQSCEPHDRSGANAPDNFETMLKAEHDEIRKRYDGTVNSDGLTFDKKNLAGLALSGGGIRSATISLGVLQHLRKVGLLQVFDYLSTVSGGGFTGAWWSAWMSRVENRNPIEPPAFPPPESIESERREFKRSKLEKENERRMTDHAPRMTDHAPRMTDHAGVRHEGDNSRAPLTMDGAWVPDGSLSAGTDPVHHLRLFSNYLTPLKGILTGDTWRAITIVARNLILTWTVLLPVLFALVLSVQLYFSFPPNAEREFLYPFQSRGNWDSTLRAQLQQDRERAWLTYDTLAREDSIRKHQPHGALDSSITEQAILLGVDSSVVRRKPWQQMIRSLDTLRDSAIRIAKIASARRDSVRDDSSASAKIAATKGKWTLTKFRRIDTLHAARQAAIDLPKAKEDSIWDRRQGSLFDARHRAFLIRRIHFASWAIIALIGWLVLLVVLWMQNHNNVVAQSPWKQGLFSLLSGLAALILLILAAPAAGLAYSQTPAFLARYYPVATLSYIALWLVVGVALCFRLLNDEVSRSPEVQRTTPNLEMVRLLEVRRNRISVYSTKLFVTFVVLTLLLAFGGFGHEFISYAFFANDPRLTQWIARSGGIVAMVISVIGTVVTALITSPKGGAESVSSLLFSTSKARLIRFTPPILVVVLFCLISWLAHDLLGYLIFHNTSLSYLRPFSCGLLAVTLYYALQEARLFQAHPSAQLVLLVFSIALIFLGINEHDFTENYARFYAIAFDLLCAFAIYLRFYHRTIKLRDQTRAVREAFHRDRVRAILTLSVIVGLAACMILGMFFFKPVLEPVGLAATAIAFIILVLVATPKQGADGSAFLLAAFVAFVLALLIVMPLFHPSDHELLISLISCMIVISLAVVVLVGWAADPNAISLHTFYRARLVRAYLGASNQERTFTTISRSQTNDDIALSALLNCEVGGPFHIVNTTLNLVATRDLSTAERHAASFQLTKCHAGSEATGYRRTDEYMSGTMTLGTAAAISGAAASPSMGSLSPTTSVAMLMTLLNIRLGFWAPNPALPQWRASQPHLWPLHILKEFFSQTTKLGSFVYLTDGGHFDNTGIYSLIQRGCRTIVVCDHGSDPKRHFAELATGLRRARIDFGTEFDLGPEFKLYTERGSITDPLGPMKQREIRGTFTLSEAHVTALWSSEWESLKGEEREAKRADILANCRDGSIVILKPMMLWNEPADVIQYGLEHEDFPQESLAEQWFTEAQFESYRQLGCWTAQQAFQQDYHALTRTEKLNALR